jgi:hypothetical protein
MGETAAGRMGHAYRRLDKLIGEGCDLASLNGELRRYPPEEQVELCRYSWGLLDDRYDEETEAALWLYAWALDAEPRRHAGPVPSLDPTD